MDPHFYNVNIEWKENRKGTMISPDLTMENPEIEPLEVATPPEFPKGMKGIWSPEHLFTASVSSCLMTTFLAIAENSKLEFTSFSCKSSGKLEKVENKFMITEVHLEPTVTIQHEKDYDRTMRILEKSEAACLISNSIDSKVILKPVIQFEAELSDVS